MFLFGWKILIGNLLPLPTWMHGYQFEVQLQPSSKYGLERPGKYECESQGRERRLKRRIFKWCEMVVTWCLSRILILYSLEEVPEVGWPSVTLDIQQNKRDIFWSISLYQTYQTLKTSWQRMATSPGTLPVAALEACCWGWDRVAVVSSNSDQNAVDSSCLLRYAPCLLHTPPFLELFEHPSILHRLRFAPCLMQTPPLTTMFVHPSLLHNFTLAPCLTHTPSCLA